MPVSSEPITVDEVIAFLTGFLHDLHVFQEEHKKTDAIAEIWNGFYELVKGGLYPWDRQYLKRMPKR